MNELTKQSAFSITEVGLTGLDDLNEDEFFALGRQIVQAEQGLQWAIGDWYNSIPKGYRNSHGSEDGKQAACEAVGLNFKTAYQYGKTAREFSFANRLAKLTFTHHFRLIHDDLTHGQRLHLLEMAERGTPDKNGEYRPWTVKRMLEDRDKLLDIAPPPEPIEEFNDKVEGLTKAVAGALPKAAGKKAINATRRGLQKLADDMRHEFDNVVNKKVEETVKGQRENLRQAKDRAEEEFNRTIKMKAGVKAFMTKAEFTLVRSCLHPDKNSHPKASEAFTIFNRLADVKAWDR